MVGVGWLWLRQGLITLAFELRIESTKNNKWREDEGQGIYLQQRED